MRRSWNTISVNVDIDVDDIIDDIETEDLKAELESRGFVVECEWNGVRDVIESLTGHIIQSLSDEEICEFVLKSLGRR